MSLAAQPAGSRPPVGHDADDRIARRSRVAGIGLVLILLAVSAFAIWSSQATANAADRAAVASRLSHSYDRAAAALSSEQSLERYFQLEARPEVRNRYTAADDELLSALAALRRDGTARDQTKVAGILAAHRTYLETIGRLYNAVEAGDEPLARALGRNEVDPSFAVIQKIVVTAADAQDTVAQAQLAHLGHLQMLTSRLTPILFLGGLLLAALLTSVTRGHRRQLDIERTRAMHDSLHDALTGLPNRLLLADRFDQALLATKRHDDATGLLLVDLDRFKEVNDTFGHHHGDGLLTQIGPRLRSGLREVDTIARLGGDEFAVLLPDVTNLAAAVEVARKLLLALAAPFTVEGVALDIEASIGVVLSGEHGDDPTTLLQRADIAMYAAKAQNLGVCVYNAELNGHSPAKLALLGELRRALELDQLLLHYQPKVSINTGEVVGAEALVRWQHPDRGLVFPDAFISVAEHTGLIKPLTTYVLDAALTQAKTWLDAGQPLMVSVNLSARNLLDEGLPNEVAGLLASTGVPAELLELEVTESAIMTEPVRAQRLLEALAALGVRLSIDDFGAGYTSLGQLKHLPVTELKIDKSFVMTMTEDTSNSLIVHSVVDLGHNLGLTIVAEGVESAAALALLGDYDCDIAQGYHLSRPIPIAAFDCWYAARRLALAAPALPVETASP